MKINKKEIKDYILNVEILVDKDEFDRARHAAYMERTDRYPVMGKAPGLATLQDLEMTYGPAVLFDEALETVIPGSFNQVLEEGGLRIMGRPQATDMQFVPGGGVKFTVKADLYPEVKLGQYLGIAVPFRRSEQQLEFERAVVQKACENMQGEIPPHMVEQKLDAITAQEKINVNNDAVYHLLADMLVVLDEAYKAAGAVRPMVQVRREAMDLMLQTASAEHELDWKEFFRSQIRDMVERYHDLPGDFDEQVTKILADRDKAKAGQSPEERTEELFKAYLGSLELTEQQWRNQRQLQAARDVCLDLLLDAVAAEEQIQVSADEIHQFIEDIAAQANMEPEEAEANINKDPLIWKMQRDKALALILNSAVTDEEGKKALDEKRAKAREKAQAEAN
ncbi:MAG: hypothetical protein IJ109_03095 [Firmicutes bacterium]|nr:hypothetical protein [Bacillota bacterium]